MRERKPLIIEDGQNPEDFYYAYLYDQWGKWYDEGWYWLLGTYPDAYYVTFPPPDPENVPAGKFLRVDAFGWYIVDKEPGPPPPTPEQIKAQFQLALTQHMDAKAKEYGYGEVDSPLGMSLLSAVSYKGDPDATFDAEGTAFFNRRSAVWVYAREQQALIVAGERTLPTVSQLLSELPALVI